MERDKKGIVMDDLLKIDSGLTMGKWVKLVYPFLSFLVVLNLFSFVKKIRDKKLQVLK